MSVLTDINAEKEIRAVLNCNDVTLVFECKPDRGNQIAAFLTIEKNNRAIPFKFMPLSDQVEGNGQMITKVVQSDLEAFANTIEMYLTGNVILDGVKIY
ncbi:MAG: hypothetical protein LBJ71_04930 [Holosporaceae bacterium]|nr:hypothetical protein [Holosporaceae bacterium]